jgi:hypothetical protein
VGSRRSEHATREEWVFEGRAAPAVAERRQRQVKVVLEQEMSVQEVKRGLDSCHVIDLHDGKLPHPFPRYPPLLL